MYLLTINLLTNGSKSFSISKLDVPLGYHRRTKPLENHEKKIKFYFIKCIFKKGSSAVLSEHCPEVPWPYLDPLCWNFSRSLTFFYPSRGKGWLSIWVIFQNHLGKWSNVCVFTISGNGSSKHVPEDFLSEVWSTLCKWKILNKNF